MVIGEGTFIYQATATITVNDAEVHRLGHLPIPLRVNLGLNGTGQERHSHCGQGSGEEVTACRVRHGESLYVDRSIYAIGGAIRST